MIEKFRITVTDKTFRARMIKMGHFKWPSKIVFNINVANCIVEFDLPVSISKHMLDPVLTALISKTFLAENTHCSFGVASKRISENSKMQ